MKKRIFKIFMMSALTLAVSMAVFGCKNSEKENNIKPNDTTVSENNDNSNENTQDKETSTDDDFVITDNEQNSNFETITENNNDTTENKNTSKQKFSLHDALSKIFGSPTKNEQHTASVEKPTVSEEVQSSEWDAIDAISAFADDYYTENYSKTRLVTKNGRLYNKASETYIDVNYLIDRGLDESYRDYPCDILLIDPDYLREFDSLSIKNAEKNLTVFVSVKSSDQKGYMIASANSAGGIITDDEYNKLMYKYSQNHGTPLDINPYSEKYQDILGFIKLYEGVYSDYFVRSMKSDDKYACVVLSPTSNINDVRQYILVNENNFWEVAISDLQSVSRVPVYVNEKLPDFNLDILPKYEISSYNLDNYNPNDIYYTLIKNGYIQGMTDIVYIAGAGKYYYARDYKKNCYLLKYDNNVWNIYHPANYKEAYEMMIKDDSFAPTFILLNE